MHVSLRAIGCCAVTLLFSQFAVAQNKYPAVAEIVKQYDADKSGDLTLKEMAKSRYARQFLRWDANNDGKVTSKEIVAFRKRFGIAADGSMLESKQPAFTIPNAADLTRIDRNRRPSRRDMANSAYVLATKPHAVDGAAYIVLTDHSERGYLESLKSLAAARSGEMIRVEDLARIHEKPKAFTELQKTLRDKKAKYVAIAPRMDSYRENMLLSMWELLSTLDDDPQLDALPGLLLASNEKSLANLIRQSIEFKSIAANEIKPFAISQVQRASETRSLQKAGVVRKHFADSGLKTPIVAIYGAQASKAPRLPGKDVWNLEVEGNRQFVKEFSAPILKTLEDSNLIVMHGHGIPGMSCSVDVDGLPADLTGKILLTGSCFSASPSVSDLPKMRQAPGNYKVEQRDAFAIRAIDNGAVVAFGHQRLSSGFPHLYPVLDSWTKGRTVGQAYQELLNGLIDLQQTTKGKFIISAEQKTSRRIPQNLLLYVIIGDPALQPFENLPQHK